MKKKLFLAIFVMGIALVVTAQTNEQAIGFRLGGSGSELSYLRPLNDNSRLELDLGLNSWLHGGFTLSGSHQWIWDINNGFDWYLGLGGQIGSVWYKENESYGLGLGIVSQIGVQYSLEEFPLQFSLDWRPSWNILQTNKPFGYEGIALSARIRF